MLTNLEGLEPKYAGKEGDIQPATDKSSNLDQMYYWQTVNGKWKNIGSAGVAFNISSPKEFESQVLHNIITNGEEVDQAGAPLCGMVVFNQVFIQSDKEGYYKFMMNLYAEGQATYNGTTIKAPKFLLERDPLANLLDIKTSQYESSGMNSADWIFGATIKNHFNANGYGMNGLSKFGTDWRGITTPNEMRSMIRSFGFSLVKDNVNSVNDKFGRGYYINAYLSEMERSRKNGNTVIMLVNVHRVIDGGEDGGLNLPNHWVQYNGGLKISGHNIQFQILTWGKSIDINIDRRNLNGWYGYMAIPKRPGEDFWKMIDRMSNFVK